MLAILGDRIPRELKVLVLAFAAVDDVGGVLVIALFYSSDVSFEVLGGCSLVLLAIVAMKTLGVRNFTSYWVAGGVFLLLMLKSGVHTTVAGVVLGLLAPAKPFFSRDDFLATVDDFEDRLAEARRRVADLQDKPEDQRSEAERLELEHWDEREDALLGRFEEIAAGTEPVTERLIRAMNPWVNYVVLPLFALASAGVVLSAESLRDAVTSRASLGIALGLLVGSRWASSPAPGSRSAWDSRHTDRSRGGT